MSPVPRTKIAALLERFRTEASGAVMVIAALSLPVVIGAVALSAEYGTGLLTRAENQRVSDAAAYAGALAYGAANSEAAMVAAAQNVARLNGIDVGDVTVRLAPSPRAGGGQVVEVVIRESQELLLANVLGALPDLEIVTQSYASVAGGETSCVLALSKTGTGITLSGGTSISAPDCAIASNGKVEVPWGTGITTKGVAHLGPVNQPGAGIKTASGGPAPLTQAETPDPLKDHGGVNTLGNRFTVDFDEDEGLPTVIAVPTGPDITFPWNSSTAFQNAVTSTGCSLAGGNGTWTVTCPGPVHNFGKISLGGGVTVHFNTTGHPEITYNFSGPVETTGAALHFGPGTFNMARGLRTGGGSTTTFGAGVFRIARGTHNCNGAGQFSICNTSTLHFGGPSIFEIYGGLANTGGSNLRFGAGSSNLYAIGPSSNGDAIHVMGGANTHFADAQANSTFRVYGNINQAGGGSCLNIPPAARHDIHGSVNAAGGLTLGRGVYNIEGYFALGNNGGGSVWCTDRNVSLLAEDVNLVIAGRTLPTGQCAGQAFCATAGYNNIVISAPTSGAYAGLAVIGPLNPAISAGFRLAGGAGGGRISGAVYFPNGPITMGGGAGAGGGASDCLTLIGTAITLSGGTSAASECAGLGGGGATRVTLVQ